jgi:phosphoribosylformylglycinamidine synthase
VTKSVQALVVRTAGTNCDAETVHALETCGAKADLLHLRELVADPRRLSRYQIMVIPGGFSYGDDIAAGKILANELKFKLGGALRQFVSEGRIVIGICNGFQVLTKAGLLPGADLDQFSQNATLTQNDSGRFQAHWVGMKAEKSRAAWLKGFPSKFELPIAHGEGKFLAKDAATLRALEKNRQVVFRYAPGNPNGSTRAIAGICNEGGNVVGLMPHPERYITPYQHPAWTRQPVRAGASTPGLLFWKSAVAQAKKVKGKK